MSSEHLVRPFRIKAFLPNAIRPPHIALFDERPQHLLSKLSGQQFSANNIGIHYGRISWTVTVRRPPARVRKFIESTAERRQWPGRLFPFETCLELEFDAEYPGEDTLLAFWKNEDLREYDIFQLWLSEFLNAVESELFACQVASDLALPGAGLFFRRGALMVEGELRAYAGRYSSLNDWYMIAQEEGLNELPEMDFAKVWARLERTNGFRRGIGDSPFGKALACATYLYGDDLGEHRFASIAWACAGLEAIFGDETFSRGRQLSQKIPLFLKIDDATGRWRDAVSKLYAVRSSIIHGNLALTSAVAGYDGMPEKHLDDEGNAKWLSHFSLHEALRRCIDEDITALAFKLVLEATRR